MSKKGEKVVKKIISIFFFSLYLFSKGTIAGAKIENQATISIDINGIKSQIKSNIDTFVVDKLIDIKLTSQDSTPIEVGAGEENRVLTFSITNLGNSKEKFNIFFESNSSSDFQVQDPRIFLDSNNNHIFDEKDKLISNILLENDKSATLFLVANIPDNNNTLPNKISINSLIAKSDLKATSQKDSKDKIDIVIRNNIAKDSGKFIIRDYWLSSKKSAIIKSVDGALHTGSIINYKIEIFIDGNNTNKEIKNIILQDFIPNGTTYIANSLKCNGKDLTDKEDSDIGSFINGAIKVRVGTIKGEQKSYVEFSVQVD